MDADPAVRETLAEQLVPLVPVSQQEGDGCEDSEGALEGSEDLGEDDENGSTLNQTSSTDEIKLLNENISFPKRYFRVFSGSGGYVWICALVAAIGGVLFGYDAGIIAGALLQLKNEFCLTDTSKEWVVSTLLIGAFIASLVGGFIVDHMGRRWAIIVNTLVFFIGAVLLTSAVVYPMLIIGRLVVGFGVSLSAIAEITYISEIAPASKRGMMVTLNEIGIVSGFLLAFLINLSFINLQHGWRAMFSLAMIPAAVQCILMVFLPSSPRYLLMRGKQQKARNVLTKLRASTNVSEELEELESSIKLSKKFSVLDVFRLKDNMLWRFLIGAGLIIFQQASGQPSVMYYAPLLFERLGIQGDMDAAWVTVGLGVAKFLFVIVCFFIIDKAGRRFFLLLGATVMTVCLIVLSVLAVTTPALVALHRQDPNFNPCGYTAINNTAHLLPNISNSTDPSGPNDENVPLVVVILAVLCLITFVAAYSLSYGPVSWLLLSEIYPSELRGRAIALATSLNWLMNFIISQTMLNIQDAIHGYSYLLYGLISLLGVVFIFLFIPETKNKSLEQISNELGSRKCQVYIFVKYWRRTWSTIDD